MRLLKKKILRRKDIEKKENCKKKYWEVLLKKNTLKKKDIEREKIILRDETQRKENIKSNWEVKTI